MKGIRWFLTAWAWLFLIPHLWAYPLPVPDTGQPKCYDNTAEIPCPAEGEAFYGQDGSYLINPPSYTKLDAGGNDLPDTATQWFMVRDNVTELIWEVKTDDGYIHDKDNRYNWQDAQDVFLAQVNTTNCECRADQSITIKDGVTIESGANIIFSAPTVIIRSMFEAKPGATVRIRQE